MRIHYLMVALLLTGCSNFNPMAGNPPPPKAVPSAEWKAYQDCVKAKGRHNCDTTPVAPGGGK